MTWCSEYSAVPRCLPARSAIRCRSVDRFVGFSVPSHVSLQRFSPRDASLSSVGSQRARFPDFAGTMKALRLPSQACPGPLWVRFQAPQASLCSCSPQRSRRGRVRVRAWALMSRAALSGTLPEDLLGISQVPWRSIPDLCPALGPRLDQQDLAMAVLPVLPPGPTHRRLQRVTCRGSTPGFGLRCLRFTSVVADAHARLASGWRAAPLPGGCRTLWNAMEGFRLPRLIHADRWLASNFSLKRENFAVVARDESKQPTDRLRRRRFTQRVTHVPRQVIEFLRC
jgi:hypothetical protein